MDMDLTWTKEAEELINRAPVFVRPMARRKIEKMAQEKGFKTIGASLVNEVRAGSMGKG